MSYKPGQLRGAWHTGRKSEVKSIQLSWAGQYKKVSTVRFQVYFSLK